MNFNKAEFERAYGLAEQLPPSEKIEIVFAGRSNVGKSSLINKLFNRKSLARVSSVPGKTATVNFYSCENVHLVDLPGYGFAKRTLEEKKKWSALTDGYFTQNDNIDRLSLVLQLIDSRIGPTKDDEMMLDYLRAAELPFAVVATKTDKLNATERKKNLAAIEAHPLISGAPVIPFSALKGEGKDELWRVIFKYTGL